MDDAGTFKSAWDAITDTPEEAANLHIRAEQENRRDYR